VLRLQTLSTAAGVASIAHCLFICPKGILFHLIFHRQNLRCLSCRCSRNRKEATFCVRPAETAGLRITLLTLSFSCQEFSQFDQGRSRSDGTIIDLQMLTATYTSFSQSHSQVHAAPKKKYFYVMFCVLCVPDAGNGPDAAHAAA
jgi:hypothetical protein